MTRTDTPFWKWLLLLIAGSFLFMLAYGFSGIPAALDETLHMPLWLQALLCVLASAGVLALYGCWWQWTEKQKARDIPMRRLAGDTAIGFGVGIFFFVLVTGCMALMGGYRIDSVKWDWNALISSLFTFLVVAVGEEVLFRGIVFRMIDDRWGTVVALIVSALIFGFVHISNNNATVWSSVAIAVEAGLLLGCWAPPTNGPAPCGYPSASTGPGTTSRARFSVLLFRETGHSPLSTRSSRAPTGLPAAPSAPKPPFPPSSWASPWLSCSCCFLGVLLAPVDEAAGDAFGGAGGAGVASVENQPVVGAGAKVLRNMALQVALDLQGRLAVR